MGMIANYQYLSDNKLSQIKRYSCQEEDLLDLVEDYLEGNDTLIDIDKMWDALLFVMTGVQALENFDMDSALANFSMEACKKADLYPDIWDYLEEEEEIKDDIRTCFVKLKNFYKKILTLKGNVLVTIC